MKLININFKNIPNKYTNELLKERINKNFKDRYDFFIFLQINKYYFNFYNKSIMGYAFINLKTK